MENKTSTKRLERFQGMALKYMAGAMPLRPYTALNYLTGTPHITDYLKGEAAKGEVRLMGQGDWTLETAPFGKGIIKAHSTISNNFLHTLNKQDSYTITYPTASLTEDYICCFTDGSKTDHGTVGGFVISDTRTETRARETWQPREPNYLQLQK